MPPPRLPQTGPALPGLLAALVAAALWGLLLTGAAAAPLPAQRSLLFTTSPLLFLPGLHRRLEGYLHAPERLRHLPHPLAPAAHWRSARAGHRRGVLLALFAGQLALTLAARASSLPAADHRALAGDLLWITLLVALVEPVIPALAALGGRRFPPSHPLAAAQHQLGGGWTTPEAVVHLYAPALGLALGLALAMPGQLALERYGLAAPALPWLAAPLALALLLRLAAPLAYAHGLWEAVPRLHEAIRTLAGPPRPEHAPAWLRHLPPALRLDLIQLGRLSPLLGLRLALLLAWAVVLRLRAAPPPPLLRQRPARRRLLASLPISASLRAGRPALATWALLLAPPLLAGLLVGLRPGS